MCPLTFDRITRQLPLLRLSPKNLNRQILCHAFIVFAEYLMLTFRRGEFLFPPVIWWRIAGTGMVAMILAPFVYFTLDAIAPALGFETRPKKKEAR